MPPEIVAGVAIWALVATVILGVVSLFDARQIREMIRGESIDADLRCADRYEILHVAIEQRADKDHVHPPHSHVVGESVPSLVQPLVGVHHAHTLTKRSEHEEAGHKVHVKVCDECGQIFRERQD